MYNLLLSNWALVEDQLQLILNHQYLQPQPTPKLFNILGLHSTSPLASYHRLRVEASVLITSHRLTLYGQYLQGSPNSLWTSSTTNPPKTSQTDETIPRPIKITSFATFPRRTAF
ncbi:hypothetical protein VP01_350g4 [Puccinia sorghi]|uniref:Uncharacterized protein n=1 Tax=Puccinia sorghi TaxID=27349 RepID=A0A0L6UVN4_9BASI|nr:hypothetical protein VP01_350g4 [Puccinia sorghi]